MQTIAKVTVLLGAIVFVACDKTDSTSSAPAQPAAQSAVEAPSPSVVAITVGSDGFQPSSVKAHKGQKLTLRFTRTTDGTCAKAVSFPELNIKKDLPLNQPVAIEIPTSEARKISFQCGMGMYKSSVVIF